MTIDIEGERQDGIIISIDPMKEEVTVDINGKSTIVAVREILIQSPPHQTKTKRPSATLVAGSPKTKKKSTPVPVDVECQSECALVDDVSHSSPKKKTTEKEGPWECSTADGRCVGKVYQVRCF